MIFTTAEKDSLWKYAAITALGLTGVIQSHVLSCLMLIFVIVIVCIVLIRKVIQPYTFLSLVTAALMTLGLNLGFIIPFLDFYGEDIMMHSDAWTGNSIISFQGNALFPLQLFSFFGNSGGGAWHTISGASEEMTYCLGAVLIFGLGLSIYLFSIHHKSYAQDRNYHATLLSLGIGCLLLYMCTCCFPWDAITSHSETLREAIYMLQFPWRLLAPATLLLSFTLCSAFSLLERVLTKLYTPLLLTVCMLLAVNCGWYFYDFAFNNATPYRVHNAHELNTMAMYSYEYLPAGTDPNAITVDRFFTDGVTMDSWQRNGTTITFTATTHPEGGIIELPLTYYKYYRCTDLSTSEQFRISPGTNQVVKVSLPGDYSDTLEVAYVEPWFWRLGEVISALSLITVVFMLFRKPIFRLFKALKQNKKIVQKI